MSKREDRNHLEGGGSARGRERIECGEDALSVSETDTGHGGTSHRLGVENSSNIIRRAAPKHSLPKHKCTALDSDDAVLQMSETSERRRPSVVPTSRRSHRPHRQHELEGRGAVVKLRVAIAVKQDIEHLLVRKRNDGQPLKSHPRAQSRPSAAAVIVQLH